MNRKEGKELGDALRDRGLAFAAADRQRLIAEAQLRFLDALLANPEGTATSDDIPETLGAKYPKGGKHVGAAVRRLAERGLIRPAGHAKSCRPPRHSGLVTRWQAAVALDTIRAERDRLRRLIAALDAANVAEENQRELFPN